MKVEDLDRALTEKDTEIKRLWGEVKRLTDWLEHTDHRAQMICAECDEPGEHPQPFCLRCLRAPIHSALKGAPSPEEGDHEQSS